MEQVPETFLNVQTTPQRAFLSSRDLETEHPNLAFQDPKYRTIGPKVTVPLPFRLNMLNNTRAQSNVSPISKAKLLTKRPISKSVRKK